VYLAISNKVAKTIESFSAGIQVSSFYLHSLYRQRVKVRQERDRTDRRMEREESEAQRKAEQPELFDF